MGKKKISEESEKLNKELNEYFPDDFDAFKKEREEKYTPELDRKRIARKQIQAKIAADPEKLQDPLALKRRAYELIIQGMSSFSYVPILVKEFNVTDAVIHYYLKDLKMEIRDQYEEVYSILRESMIMDLLKMKNDARTINEKIKCYELLIKITGLSQENINIKQTNENRTFVITQVEQKKKEE